MADGKQGKLRFVFFVGSPPQNKKLGKNKLFGLQNRSVTGFVPMVASIQRHDDQKYTTTDNSFSFPRFGYFPSVRLLLTLIFPSPRDLT